MSWKRSTGDSRLDEIVDGIVAAFPAEPLPKFDQIVGKVGPMDFEKKEVRKFLKSKSWTDVVDDQEGLILTLLSPEGWCYFLPAFLLGDMYRQPPRFEMYHSALYWSRKFYKDYVLKRLNVLNQDQRMALKAYVEFAKNAGDEEASLAWEQMWRDI